MCPVHSPFGACLDPFLPLIPILCHREPALALTGQLSCLQPLTSAQALIQNTQKFQVQIWRQLYFTAYPDPNIYAQFWWKTVLEWKYTQGGKRISRVTAHPPPPPRRNFSKAGAIQDLITYMTYMSMTYHIWQKVGMPTTVRELRPEKTTENGKRNWFYGQHIK